MTFKVESKMKPTKEELEKELTRLRVELSEFKTFYQKGSISLLRWVNKNFDAEGKDSKVNRSWAPFKAGGRWIDGVLDTSAKLLQDEGRLRVSYLPFATKDDGGIRSKLPYAKVHDEGSKTRGIPMRRVIPAESDVAKQLREILEDHVKGAIRS